MFLEVRFHASLVPKSLLVLTWASQCKACWEFRSEVGGQDWTWLWDLTTGRGLRCDVGYLEAGGKHLLPGQGTAAGRNHGGG